MSPAVNVTSLNWDAKAYRRKRRTCNPPLRRIGDGVNCCRVIAVQGQPELMPALDLGI